MSHLIEDVILSTSKLGELASNFSIHAGDISLADRAYGIWRSLEAILSANADAILRLTYTNFPLVNSATAQSLDIVKLLSSLSGSPQLTEMSVQAKDDPQGRALRLIVIPLPQQKAQQARRRVRRQAKKKGRTAKKATLLAASFCILLTTLEEYSTNEIGSLYGLRWQIESQFKVYKSGCQLDELPSYPCQLAESVLLAKLLILVVVSKEVAQIGWVEYLESDLPFLMWSKMMSRSYQSVKETLYPSTIWLLVLAQIERFRRHLSQSRRKGSKEKSSQLQDVWQKMKRMVAPTLPDP